MSAPLRGLKVLDLSRVLAGPWATQTLSDLGADIIKVERPGEGDETRTWGPPFREANGFRETSYFLGCNRGKRSLALDFTKPEGAAFIRELASKVDIVVENFKVDGLKKYGLDGETLVAANPKLIYCSITGFGRTGPYRARQGYDSLIQAMGGLMSITGEEDGKPGAGPQKVGVAIVDVLTGVYVSTAILAALHERGQSGRGQMIDVSLFDVQLAALANQASAYLTTGVVPQRLGGGRHPSIVPYRHFAARGGRLLMLAVANDGQFAAFCRAANRPELAGDSRYRTNKARVENRESLDMAIGEIIAGHALDEWVRLGEKHGFPCGPVNDLHETFSDPHTVATQVVVHLEHSKLGDVKGIASPMRFSRTKVEYRLPPPRLGEHTREILQEFGVDDSEIIRLKSLGVVGDS